LKRLKLFEHFIVERHLITAHGTPIGRVKCENDRSPSELNQRYRLVWFASQAEIRRSDSGT
jgi:hypothetical protein